MFSVWGLLFYLLYRFFSAICFPKDRSSSIIIHKSFSVVSCSILSCMLLFPKGTSVWPIFIDLYYSGWLFSDLTFKAGMSSCILIVLSGLSFPVYLCIMCIKNYFDIVCNIRHIVYSHNKYKRIKHRTLWDTTRHVPPFWSCSIYDTVYLLAMLESSEYVLYPSLIVEYPVP